jgi:hypothetical protein
MKDVDNKIMSLLDAISIRNPKMKYKKADNKATDKKKDITPPTNLTSTNPENLVNSNSEAQQNDVLSAADAKLPENSNPNEEEDKGPITEEVEKKLDSLKDVGDDIRPAEPVNSAKKTTGGVPPPEINNSAIPAGVPKTMNVADLLKPSDVLGMFIDPKKMKVLAGLIIQNQDDIGNGLVSRNAENIPSYLSKVFEPGKIEELVQEGKAKYLNNLKTKKSHIHDVFLAALKEKLKDMVLKDNKSKIEFCKKFNEVFVCKNDAATPEPPPETTPSKDVYSSAAPLTE